MKNKLDFSNILFIVGFIICLTITLLFLSWQSVIIFLSTILGMLASKGAKDGKWYTFLFDIFSYVFYIQICLNANYIGELILSFLIIFINCFCLKEWKNNSKDNFVSVNTLKSSEIRFVLFVSFLTLIIYSLMLFIFKSELALLNAVSTIAFLLSNYFSYRRSVLQFYSLIVYELAYIALWWLSSVGGNISSLVLLVGGLSELILDFLAIYEWKKISNLQRSIKCKTLYLTKN